MDNFVPLEFEEQPLPAMEQSARDFYERMSRRRTVRHFSDRAVPRQIIDHAILSAATAPSGAHIQPWHFVAISDPVIKQRIRVEAEIEEREFYERRATPEWLADLAPLGTDHNKPFLEIAPYLIAVFAQPKRVREDGSHAKNYYVTESVGIAMGFLIAALHHAGLATLTHTPSPMKFLNHICGRPPRERPLVLLVVGFPAAGAAVPDLTRKPLAEIATFL